MYGDRQNICQVLQKSDHRKEKAMEIRKNSGPLKWILIGISTLFLIVMLILPLTYVLVTAFGEGIKVFVAAVTDYYALKAIGLTLEVTLIAVVVNTIFGIAASWCITRFQFHGKKILSTLIDLPLTISPVIAGLIYILTFGRQSILYEYLRSAGIKLIFAVPGIVVCDISVYIEGDHPGALHAWHRRGGSGCTDGSKRIYDFPENYLPTYQMGIALRNRALYGKSDGRVWCGICFVRSPSGKNKYDAALH